MERYEKQVLLKEIGMDGQIKLKQSKVIIIGCGALGTAVASNLTRSGIGYIKIVDRDYIELSNLQRQTLFDEIDIEQNHPKAKAAQYKLEKINSKIVIEGLVMNVNSSNILKLCRGIDLIIDATDNLETRYLINDVSIKLGIPWIYGAVIGSAGMTYNIIPGETPCFRCVMKESSPTATIETSDSAGVLNTIVNIITSMQTTEALKILVGKKQDLVKELRFIDIWHNDFELIKVKQDKNCITCASKNYNYLNS